MNANIKPNSGSNFGKIASTAANAVSNVGKMAVNAAANVGKMATNVSSNIGQMTSNSNFGSNNISSNSNSNSSIRNFSNSSNSSGKSSTSWMILAMVIVGIMILFAVYYETIGYYFQIGWDKLKWSHDNGEKIKIDLPGGTSAWMNPDSGMDSKRGQNGVRDRDGDGDGEGPIERAIERIETDVENALGGFGSDKQVFNINRNIYKFTESEPLCRAFGAELATYDQVKEAYKAGADWCNYGWTKGQLALYPTQQATYDKIQMGPEADRMSCGVPGVNGGFFPNEDQRFGVNCYGPRPSETALDRRDDAHSDIAYDRDVARFRAERDSISVMPWSASKHQWSE